MPTAQRLAAMMARAEAQARLDAMEQRLRRATHVSHGASGSRQRSRI